MEDKKMNIAPAQLNENELENVTGGMDLKDNFWNPLRPDPILSDPAPLSAGEHTFQPPLLALIPINSLGINDVDVSFDMEVTIRKQ